MGDLNQKQEECNDSIDAWVENEHSLICFSSLSSELLTHFNCHNIISFSIKGVGSNRIKILSFIIRVSGFPGEDGYLNYLWFQIQLVAVANDYNLHIHIYLSSY